MHLIVMQIDDELIDLRDAKCKLVNYQQLSVMGIPLNDDHAKQINVIANCSDRLYRRTRAFDDLKEQAIKE